MSDDSKTVDPGRLTEEIGRLRYHVNKLSSLVEVSIIINSTLDPDRVINLVMEKAQSVMRAEASSVLLINEETGKLECEVALGEVGSQVMEKITLNLGEGIAGWVAQSGEPLIVHDADKDARFTKKVDEETGFKTRSILAVPLIVRGKVIGVAEVINPLEDQLFSQDDLKLFSTFGRQVALAIENARMHKSLLEKQRIEQQLEAARIIQEGFMPQHAPVCPHNRYQVAAKSIAATAIGGDFYDFIEFDSDTLGVLMGDVSGKGIPAALYMARLVSDFRFHTLQRRDAAEVVRTINALLVERSRRGMFVTLQYAVLNSATGLLQMVNGGHLPALRVNADGSQVEQITSEDGLPLGIMNDAAYSVQQLQLAPGDTIVTFTDGLSEAVNRKGEQLSIAAVQKFLKKRWQSADEVVDALVRHTREFARNAAQHDDLTVVALRWTGGAAS